MLSSRHALALAVAALVAGACARGQSDYVGEPGSAAPVATQGGASSGNGTSGGNGNGTSGGTGNGTSGGAGSDAGGSTADGGVTAVDAAPPHDAQPPPVDAAPPVPDSGSLDPLLSLPDPSGVACDPGVASEFGCPAISVCRISSPGGGRCESCTDCGNRGATCSTGKDCDILFECYDGRCTNFCQLGTYNCGPIADCLNVGHPTIGVCRL